MNEGVLQVNLALLVGGLFAFFPVEYFIVGAIPFSVVIWVFTKEERR